MASFSILILLGTSVFVTGNTNYYGQNPQDSHTNYPMDYFDDIQNRDMKLNPSSMFSFSFEQTRRDQPPQIEMREETVGKYFNRKPQTTTPVSIFSMNADRQSQHVYPNVVPTNNYQQHWNEQQASAVPPPPKFAFSRPNNPQPELQRNSAPTWNSPTVRQNAHPRNPFNTNNVPHVPNVQAQPPRAVHWTQPPPIQSTPSPYYVPTPTKFHMPQKALSSRGNHKFSWDDIKKPEEIKPTMSHQHVGLPQVSTTPQSIHNKPPPPVPTLSPWYDNFGK